MDVKLQIQFEGTAPGLAEHRLSLGAFSKALEQLLATYRRIASGLITNALEEPGYGISGGKYAKEAERLDLEIEAITEGSTGLEILCTSRLGVGDNLQLFAGLALDTSRQMLDYIEAESRGQPRHVAARKFLAALPPGVSGQRYRLLHNGKCDKEVTIGEFAVLELPRPGPHLESFVGFVVGVGFEPGKAEVRLKHLSTERQVTCSATPEQVGAAIRLRDLQADAMILAGQKCRLLWLRPSEPGWEPPPAEERTKMVLDKWDDVLRRLPR